MTTDSTNLKRIAGGTILGILVGVAGFFFAETGTKGMGVLIFCLFPIIVGMAIGFTLRTAKAAGAAALISLLGSLVILIALGKEGPLCALMAFVFLAGSMGVGVLGGVGFRMLVKPGRAENTTIGMFVVLAPALLFTSKQLERPLLERPRIESINTTIWVPDSITNTWTDIQSIDSIRAGKPWLMHVGLPVPQRCVLERPGMGAKRTCYFDKGFIEETVTEWNPPYTLGLVIDRTHMPGRHWMGFETAAYHLQPNGSGTQLTRTTVISSHLHPAWYWRPLERWGVSAEHSYILQDIVIRARQPHAATAPEK